MASFRGLPTALGALFLLLFGAQPPTRALQDPQNRSHPKAASQPQTAQQSSAGALNADVVTISANLVQVPVIVRTKSGLAVRGLKKEDFVVEEEGSPQSIVTFARIEGRFGLRPGPNASPVESQVEAAVESVSPYRILILLDTHHLWREFKRAKDAALKFVKEEKASGESVLVMSTHDDISELQNFASDPAQLVAAMNRIKPRPFMVINSLGLEMTEYDAFEIDRGNRSALSDYVQRYAIKNSLRLTGSGETSSARPLPSAPWALPAGDTVVSAGRFGSYAFITPVRYVQGGGGSGGGGSGGGGSGGGNPGDNTPGGSRPGGSAAGGLGGDFGMMAVPRSTVEAQVKQAAQDMVMQSSLNTLRGLDAMREIIRRMGRLEGRKVVILLSEGYFIGFGARTGFPITDYIQALIDVAARNNVTFYPIDARGLATTGLTAEMSGSLTRQGPRMAEAVTRANASFSEAQSGLHALASGTGGFTYFNRNDLVQGFRKAVEDNTYYYVIGYTPSRPPDGKYRRITVKVNHDGYLVRSRAGYFALRPGQELQLARVSTRSVSEKEFREAMKEAAEAAKAMQAGQLDEALKRFNKSIQIAPVNDRVFYYVGMIYQHQGDLAKAIEAYRRSIEIAPAKPDASLALGRLYLGQQNLEEAEKVLSAFGQVQADHAEGLYVLAIIREQRGRILEAYQSAARAISLKPDGVEMYLSAGRLAIRVGREEEGVGYLRKYIQLNGQFAENVKKFLEQNGQKL